MPDGVDIDQLYFDLWYCNGPIGIVLWLCANGGARSFTFGSCYPIQTFEATALQVDQSDISSEQRRALGASNAIRYLGWMEGLS
ncbi:hypothetical protein [Paenibacillus cremeus]|uniref:hypothetical protein n=1 Tax=Paenibacillus cremeus TaxID=2163881 RepID=UPI0011A39130|nr:hypothetical protein [Paenibacillus cremeus]